MSANLQKKYDLTSSAFQLNPYPTYAEIQDDAPILQIGQRHWLITGYAEAHQVLSDHKTFVKDYRNTLPQTEQNRLAETEMADRMLYRNMLALDPPDHTRLRNLVSKAFTAQRMNQLAPRITTIAETLLEACPPHAPFDLIDTYAFPLPIIVICELLGIPAEDRAKFRVWSNAFVDGSNQYNKHMADFLKYINRVITEKRTNPQDDLITALTQAEEQGDSLSLQELYSMIILLIVAGHETTVNLIGNGVLALLQNPDQMAQLRAQPELIDSAVEEFLRYDNPVERASERYAATDIELGGHLITRGSYIQVMLGAANRDPELAQCPHELDITRPPAKHLGFGYGIHYCLGAPLARLEGRIAINTLLAHCPNLALAIEPTQLNYRQSFIVRGVHTLPVIWHPA